MLGQRLLDRMRLIDRELEIAPGGPDVDLALIALNTAQDDFEAMLAGFHPQTYGQQTGMVTTTPNQETTLFPLGQLLRVDRLQALDPSTNRPVYDLQPLYGSGSHIEIHPFYPWMFSSAIGVGQVRAYSTDGRQFYWSPVPGETQTIRWYGLLAQADITAAGTFAYPDFVAQPLATVAARLIKIGLGDDTVDVIELEGRLFPPVLQQMTQYQRDRAGGYKYRYWHTS